MFCPKCGLQIPDGTNFCPRCGTNLAAQYNQTPMQPYTQQPYMNQPPQYPNQPVPQQPVQPEEKESVSDGVAKGCGALILAVMIIVVAVFIVLSVKH